jgi:hypothetical protein
LGGIFSLKRVLQADDRDYGSIVGYIGGNGGVFWGERFERRVLTGGIWIGWRTMDPGRELKPLPVVTFFQTYCHPSS